MALLKKNEIERSYVEILEILKHVEPQYVQKIPLEVIEFFQENKDPEYQFVYDDSVSLIYQDILENTRNLLALLNVNYWCNNEEEKQELVNTYKQNDIKYTQAIEDTKVDPNWNEVFNKKESISENNEVKIEQSAVNTTSEMVEYKENAFKRFINKIKNIFKK